MVLAAHNQIVRQSSVIICKRPREFLGSIPQKLFFRSLDKTVFLVYFAM